MADRTTDACSLLQRLLTDNRGVTAVEYGVLAAIVVLGAVQALSSLGVEVGDSLDSTTASLIAEDAAPVSAAAPPVDNDTPSDDSPSDDWGGSTGGSDNPSPAGANPPDSFDAPTAASKVG